MAKDGSSLSSMVEPIGFEPTHLNFYKQLAEESRVAALFPLDEQAKLGRRSGTTIVM